MGRLTKPMIVPETGEILAYTPNPGVSERSIKNKLGQYEDLEEQGLLIRLPCKVGDTVYQHMITGLDEAQKPIYGIFEAKVFNYTLDSMNLCFWTETTDRYKYRNEMPISAFGKTVFLTKEEAEAALERMKNER